MESCYRSFKVALWATIQLFFCIFFIAALFPSCKSAPTQTVTKIKCVTCANGGSCINDTCVCLSGFQGTNCEIASRPKFLGNWTVSEKGSITSAAQYPVTISEGAGATDLLIRNFNNYFSVPIAATFYYDTIFIANQQHQGKVVFGIGYIYTTATSGQYGAISMAYEIVDTATGAVDDFGFNPAVYHGNPSIWNK